MKLIQQAILHFQEGNSDKVYEVDLCEVSDGKFVVNFRYGRRGTALREGTKTIALVQRDQADAIFEKLVDSKTSKGYIAQDSSVASSETPVSATPGSVLDPPLGNEADATESNPQIEATQKRIREGFESKSSWSLSRAIWRAGELAIGNLEKSVELLIGKDSMTDYCIAYALGRANQVDSAATLKLIQSVASANLKHSHIQDICQESIRKLSNETQKNKLIEQWVDRFPPELKSFWSSKSRDKFSQWVVDGLNKKTLDENLLGLFYLIDDSVTRPVLIGVLKSVGFEPPFFRPIRRIFKAAEFRRDSEIFGLIAHRVETYQCKFRIPDYYWHNYKKPTLGENATHAFSAQTRDYFRKRVWKTLDRMAKLEDIGFVSMAVGTLLPFKDSDAKPVRSDGRWDYRAAEMRYFHWDSFGAYWAFNQLLFANSPRFTPTAKNFRLANGQEVGAPKPDRHEAPYLDLWKREPRGLVHLLCESQCEHVHQFAAPLLAECTTFCSELPTSLLKQFLQSKYSATNELGFRLAVDRYDANDPDFELVLLLANCSVEEAREQAKQWIEAKQSLFFENLEFTFSILTSPYAKTRSIGSNALSLFPSETDFVQALTGKLIAFLLTATSDDIEIAEDVCSLMLRSYFDKSISGLGEPVLCDLLSGSLEPVLNFAGAVILQHPTLSKSPSERVLRAMLECNSSAVRAMAVKLISDLPESVLARNEPMLAGLLCHPLEDIRLEARPLIKRLVDRDPMFARKMAEVLIQRLLTPGAPEGVPTYTSKVLREDFSRHMDHIASETVWKLLQSRSPPAQEVGGLLLPTNVRSSSLDVSEIVKLSNHEILSVRQASWKMYEDDIGRMRNALSTAVRILDSKWDDSRQFGFEYLKNKIDEDAMTPEVLISICDSVRPDVQQFGREMVTRRFRPEDGPEYLLKLSEHPSADLQLFASNFLIEFASEHPERISQMKPYFVSILSRVNKSRVAKDRVLRFLTDESKKDKKTAEVVGEIFDRISATCAIGDKATTIEGMLELHQAYPEIDLPIELKKLEVR